MEVINGGGRTIVHMDQYTCAPYIGFTSPVYIAAARLVTVSGPPASFGERRPAGAASGGRKAGHLAGQSPCTLAAEHLPAETSPSLAVATLSC
jgi:hypothetical protein